MNVEEIWRRFQGLIGIGQTTAPPKDQGPNVTQQSRLSPSQTRDSVPHLQNWGFQSAPPEGSDIIYISLGGNPSSSVIIASGHQTVRVALQPGETAISDNFGHKVHLTSGGVTIVGDVTVTGKLTVSGEIKTLLNSGISLSTHQHLNDSHGDTEFGPKPGT